MNADGSVTSNHHNHVLIENKYAMHGLRASRGAVPDDLQKIGRIMHTKSGCHPSDIMRILNELAIDQGLSVGGWTIEDIKSLYRPTAGERMFDTANLFCQLQARNATEGLEYYARHEGDRLKSLFVQLDGSIQDWARTGSKNVVLFDPTWGTNKYGLKMCCFTTLTGTGRTVILAMSLLDTETVDNFEWSFRCFADTFKTAPAIIFTDGCDKIRRAIVQVSAVRGDPWFDIRHMLCVYHLSGNLFTHVRHLFRDSFENWKKVLNKFWQIAKKGITTQSTPSTKSGINLYNMCRLILAILRGKNTRYSGWRTLESALNNGQHGLFFNTAHLACTPVRDQRLFIPQ